MEYQSEHWGQNFGFFFGTAAYQLENAIKYLSEGRATVWGLWIPNLLWSFFALAIMIPGGKGGSGRATPPGSSPTTPSP